MGWTGVAVDAAVLAAALVCGAGFTVALVAFNTVLQRRTPADLVGRRRPPPPLACRLAGAAAPLVVVDAAAQLVAVDAAPSVTVTRRTSFGPATVAVAVAAPVIL